MSETSFCAKEGVVVSGVGRGICEDNEWREGEREKEEEEKKVEEEEEMRVKSKEKKN